MTFKEFLDFSDAFSACAMTELIIDYKNTIQQLDPLYFLDYALFTGCVRDYASRTFEEAFSNDPNSIRKPLHFVNLLKEEYAAYEDVGAFLLSFLNFKSGKASTPLETLISFRPGEANISKIFELYNIQTGKDLFGILKIEEWIPINWDSWSPDFNLKKTLTLMCDFFVEDCQKNQKKYGIRAYNKIKHGLLMVPSGKIYLPDLPEGPAMIIKDDNKVPTLYGFEITNSDLENRYRSIHFIQCNLRLFAALYVCWKYPKHLALRNFSSPQYLFESSSFSDVQNFLKEVALKK